MSPGQQAPAVRSALGAATVAGVVRVPAGVTAEGAKAGRRVLAAAEAPLADAEVALTDADGTPVPGVASVHTNAQGEYTFHAVPKGYAFVVTAHAKTVDGRIAQLHTLVDTSADDGAADVSVATTVVAAGALEGHAGLAKAFDHAAFRKAAEAIAATLDPTALPDLSDHAAVTAYFHAVAAKANELEQAVTHLKQQLHDTKLSLGELQHELDAARADDGVAVAGNVPSGEHAASASPASDHMAQASPGPHSTAAPELHDGAHSPAPSADITHHEAAPTPSPHATEPSHTPTATPHATEPTHAPTATPHSVEPTHGPTPTPTPHPTEPVHTATPTPTPAMHHS